MIKINIKQLNIATQFYPVIRFFILCYSPMMQNVPIQLLILMRSVAINKFKAFNDRSSTIAVLMSSTTREYSQARQSLGHGLFTYYLVSGMIGNANLNNDKIVDITELFLFVRNNVIEQSNHSQIPTLFGKYSRYMPISKIE